MGDWKDKHGVNCYFCCKLFDEREGMNADEFNKGDGGSICPKCLQRKLDGRRVNESIDGLLSRAGDMASQHVQSLARNILRENPDLDEFIMAMGSWGFKAKTGDCDDDKDNRFDELRDFIANWDRDLHITGEPMRFTADGKKITDW